MFSSLSSFWKCVEGTTPRKTIFAKPRCFLKTNSQKNRSDCAMPHLLKPGKFSKKQTPQRKNTFAYTKKCSKRWKGLNLMIPNKIIKIYLLSHWVGLWICWKTWFYFKSCKWANSKLAGINLRGILINLN